MNVLTHVGRRAGGPAVLVLAAAVALAGCVTRSVKRVNVTPAEHAEAEIPERELLDVNVAVFDTGLPDPKVADPDEGVFPEVRKAESRYVAAALRKTLERTGQWGAVRVVPEPIEASELLVTGRIVESDGRTLELAVRAVDASGRIWLDKTYEEEAAKLSYADAQTSGGDAFQDLYNRIANDLLAERRTLPPGGAESVRQISFLRFARSLAPDALGSYLHQDGSRWSTTGLPAREDPNVARVDAIRERDLALVDALDQHYTLFAAGIRRQYDEWRGASYREAENLSTLDRESMTQMALGAAAVAGGIAGLVVGGGGAPAAASTIGILGGSTVFKAGYDKRGESKIHAEALKELGQSLESDLKPQIVELEGKTVTLSGSAEAQYEEWRRILREIYAEETGFTPGAPPPAK